MKNILITGATGFVGNSLSTSLNRNFKNYNLTILGRKTKSWNSDYVKKNVKIFDLVKDNYKKLKEKEFETIIHCAGIHNINKKSWNNYYQSNINVTDKIINNLKFKKLIFISTFSVLSNNKLKKDIPDPSNFYGLSKYISEKLLEFFLLKKNNKKIYIIRLPIIIGKNTKNNLIDHIFNQLKNKRVIKVFGNSKLKRNLIHIDIVIETILKILYKKNFKRNYEIFNVASSNSISIENIIKFISNELNIKPKVKIINKKQNFNYNVNIDIRKSVNNGILVPYTIKQNLIKYLNEKNY